jgi:hypothetical protein
MLVDCRLPAAKETRPQLPFNVKQSVGRAVNEAPAGVDRRGLVHRLALQHGVGQSSIYRWAADERAGRLVPRARQELDQEVLDEIMLTYYRHLGDATAAHTDLLRNGVITFGPRRLQQVLTNSVTRLEKAAAGGDEASARLLGTYISYTVPHRDYEWQIDLVDLCINVELADGDVEHVWLVAVVDKRTGLTRGWALTIGQPTADGVVQALVMAIKTRMEPLAMPDGTTKMVRVGGAPLILRCDNGKQLLADLTQLLLCEVGTTCQPADEYLHTAQGQIERWNREAKRFSLKQFGTTRGPKTIRGVEPYRGAYPVMTPAAIEALVRESIHERDRTPQRGRTKSPLALYAHEDTPGAYVGPQPSDAVLASFGMRQVTKPRPKFKVDRGCVRYRHRRWTSKKMAELHTDTVELWESLIDPDYLEVRSEGRRFQVKPNDELDPDEQEDILDDRGETIRRANRYRAEGAHRARQEAEEAQATVGATPTNPAPAGDIDDPTEDLMGRGGTGLLDLLDETFKDETP